MKTLPQKLNPKSNRQARLWWIIEQQSRRRRRIKELLTAEWLPHSVSATVNDVLFIDWDAFSLLEPSSIYAISSSGVVGTAFLSLSGLEKLTGLSWLDFPNQINLTTVGEVPASCTTLSFGGCSLTSASIDAITASLDAGGAIAGYLDVSGGLNETPSAEAITSISNLQSKDWEVYTN